VIPFTNGVSGLRRVKCFKRRHPELAMRKLQASEQRRAKYLCPNIVCTFYDNLENSYNTHKYQPDHVWNCDESGAQAGRDGGGFVIARRGSKTVLKVTPDSREWLFVLSCINVADESLPNYYIFKGKKKS